MAFQHQCNRNILPRRGSGKYNGDGFVGVVSDPPDSWGNMRAGAGNGHNDDGTDYLSVIFYPGADPNYYYFRRGICGFNTASLPDAAVINSAVVSLYVAVNYATTEFNLTNAAPASNNALADSDFGNVGN